MFDRRNIRRIYLNITEKTKDFLLSDKSREFFVFFIIFMQYFNISSIYLLYVHLNFEN